MENVYIVALGVFVLITLCASLGSNIAHRKAYQQARKDLETAEEAFQNSIIALSKMVKS